jgi:hypothetical protein
LAQSLLPENVKQERWIEKYGNSDDIIATAKLGAVTGRNVAGDLQ